MIGICCKLWNLDGKLLKNLNEHNAEVKSVCFSPDGNALASGSSDRTVKIWSLDGKELLTLQGHQSAVKSVCFSADGETIASASVNGKIILWDFELAHLMELGNNWIQDYLETLSCKNKKRVAALRAATLFYKKSLHPVQAFFEVN